MARYLNPAIRQLKDQQVKYAPVDVRLEQMDKAESLLNELDSDRSYRYRDICERVTDFKSEMYPDLVIDGADAIHDLRMFVEDLSTSTDLPVEKAGEPVLTVNDLSQKFNVSTKTVDRWRKRGLVSRRFRFGNRSRVGFLKSSVHRFLDEHGEDVERGRRFTQLSEEERESIIRRARRMAARGGCPSEISKRLAKRLQRSPETIRYTLKTYDEEHPEMAVFPNARSPLDPERKREIYRRHKRGVSVGRLAEEYCRTKNSIYRIVSEVRAETLLEEPLDYMDSPEFHLEGAEEKILGPPPVTERKEGRVKAPPGLPPYLASLYAIPLLTREDEQYWFRKFNYLKYRAATLRDQVDPRRPKSRDLDQLEELLTEAGEVKNFLIRSNLRLVVSIAKRHIKPSSNFFEMVSDGNMSLIRAIEKFDYTKGNKFSTYASWAIMKNFARSIPQEHKVLDRYRTGHETVFDMSPDYRANQFKDELVNQKQRHVIMNILDQLEERERAILMHRYGLEQGEEPKTLQQVGEEFGVTKERIRQLESRALKKALRIAEEARLDIPGI
jgi:RNA polymerase primary sigma factor